MFPPLVRRLLAILISGALVLAGCDADATVHASIGCPGCCCGYVEVTNDTDEIQYVYVDGCYAGWLYPGESAVFTVCDGWHHVSCYEEYEVFVDPYYCDFHVDVGVTFFWIITALVILEPADAAQAPPPAAPEPVADDCPENELPPAELPPEPVAEVF
jgi:hypothetical protein